MKKKYGIFVIILIILLAGTVVTLINDFYSFGYLYNSLIRREFSINPRAEVVPDKEYKIRIWYYPFYRTVIEKDEKDFFKMVQKEVSNVYPNIKLVVGELTFQNGFKLLQDAIRDGNPPDIFFNFTNYDLIDEHLEIPVNQYLNNEEREGFYTVDWNRVNYRDQLWGWPLLVHKQFWLKKNIAINHSNFTNKIENLNKSTLVLNYYDPILLKQLLTLFGLNTFKVEKRELDIDSYRALEGVFLFLNSLRRQGILPNERTKMPDTFIKKLLEEETIMAGPANPFLENFIETKANNINKVAVSNLAKIFVLNIFRQKRYQGDDHTRAVMEVARIIAKQYSSSLADELGMEP
ncbi:MAG: hypothetical protein ACOCQN_02465, partial [Halanaerobiaceae bacterium]